MESIDLNCDLGEGAGQDEALLDLVSSANVACGFHAGDPTVMAYTVRAAASRGVAVGAHPGLPDRAGFGRRARAVGPDEVYSMVLYQIGALAAFTRDAGCPLRHVKPHGALYGMAEAEPPVAQAVAEAVRAFDASLLLYALAGGELARVGRDLGLRVAEEAFPDRAYEADGRLAPRDLPGAAVHAPAEAARRALGFAQGERRAGRADTLCIHGDEPSAPAVARAVRAALMAQGILIQPPGGR